jgi:hypothetical protein
MPEPTSYKMSLNRERVFLEEPPDNNLPIERREGSESGSGVRTT